MIYDKGVTLLDTWRALEDLVDEGKCKAIGLSDVDLEQAKGIFGAARIKPEVVHVEPIARCSLKSHAATAYDLLGGQRASEGCLPASSAV